jgi:hypothetical protein
METWHYLVGGGAVLIGGALLWKRKVDEPVHVDGALAAKPGHPLTSEEARAAQLIPTAQLALERTRAELEQDWGIRTYVGSTRRNPDEQAKIVAKGNSATQKSWHLLGRAVDLYPYDPDTGKPDLAGKHVDLFRTMQEVGAGYGWTNIAFNPDGSKRLITTTKNGKQVKVWDGGHMQFTEGMTFAQASHDKGGPVA